MGEIQDEPKLQRKYALAIACFIVMFFFILLIGSVAISESTCELLYDGNRYYIWLPKSVSNFFADETINFEFLLPAGQILSIHGNILPGMVGELRCMHVEEASYLVSMTWVEAVSLATSEKPITTFREGWQNGRIIVSPNGIGRFDKFMLSKDLLTEDSEPVPENIREMFEKYKDREEAKKAVEEMAGDS